MKLRLWLALAMAAFCLPAHAERLHDAIDLRVVVDVSRHAGVVADGALRGQVIERLMRTLPNGAYGGIWTYARYVNLLVKHEPVTELWKQIGSIHARNLTGAGEAADLGKALRAATWDLASDSPRDRHVVLITSGEFRTADPAQDANVKQAFVNDWVRQLAQSNVTVHVLVTQGAPIPELLRQIADVSGGLRAVVADGAQADRAVLDLVDLITARNQALVDELGRFQVEPGVSELTALWLTAEANAELVQPDGTVLDRKTPIAAGRWVVGRDFEMASIVEPQVGWWQVRGEQPERVALFADVEIRIDGLSGSVVPTEESAATISLFSGGERVADQDFLALLEVRAWRRGSGERVPLPIEQRGSAFAAYFVNLDDGRHELEVQVSGPTFERRLNVPFVVHNPLRAEVLASAAAGHVVWLQFSHPAVDYGSVRVAGKFRRPPEPAQVIPAAKGPAGTWKIPLEWRDGIVESTFSISGNYLNKNGFFMKTKGVNLVLPVAAEGSLVYQFDAAGEVIEAAPTPAPESASPVEGRSATPVSGSAAAVPAPVAALPPESPAAVPTPDAPLIPIWFTFAIAALNLLVAAFVWWMWKPKPLPTLPDAATV